MGSRTVALRRALGLERNRLDTTAAMPEDAQIACVLDQAKRASITIARMSAQRERI